MVEKVPGNFKNRYIYNETGVNCSDCNVELTQNHLALCPARASMRRGLNISNLDDAVIYFRRYLADVKKTEERAGS